jgi:outer membrane protein assembly factor BamB
MSKRLALVATGIALLVAVPAGSALTTGGAGSRPLAGRLVAYDLATGDVRFDVPSAAAMAFIHTVAAGVVVVAGADSCRHLRDQRPLLSAYSSSSGARLWQRPIPGLLACGPPLPSVATDGVVTLVHRGSLEGWSTRDGTTRWRNRRVHGWPLAAFDAIATPARAESSVVFLIDGRDGSIERAVTVRSQPAPWFLTSRTAIVSARTVPVGPEQRLAIAPEERLVAIDRASGRRLWHRVLPAAFSSAAGAGGVVMVSWLTVQGYVADPSELLSGHQTMTSVALDVRSGRRLWRRITPVPGDLPLSETVFTAGAGLALFVHGQTLEALDLRTGKARWRVQLALPNGAAHRSILASGTSVAVVGPKRVSVFDARDGSTRWSKPIRSAGVAWRSPAAISDGALLVPATSTGFIPFGG